MLFVVNGGIFVENSSPCKTLLSTAECWMSNKISLNPREGIMVIDSLAHHGYWGLYYISTPVDMLKDRTIKEQRNCTEGFKRTEDVETLLIASYFINGGCVTNTFLFEFFYYYVHMYLK